MLPSASFSVSATTAFVNEAVNFTDNSTDEDGTIQSWSWNFQDGGVSTEQNPSHTYTVAGVYNVTLTVIDDRGGQAETEGGSSYVKKL